MGGLAPIATQAIGLGAPVAGATLTPLFAKGIMNYVDYRNTRDQQKSDQDLALRQLQERQNLQMRQIEADSALEKQRLTLEAEKSESARRDSLRRAVARQRASFGASGIGNNGGSAEAVLLGLFDESDEERAQREALDGLRNSALDAGVSQQRSLNILQRTQLQGRQKFSRNSSSFF
jgi:hypothetical protein